MVKELFSTLSARPEGVCNFIAPWHAKREAWGLPPPPAARVALCFALRR